MTRTIDIRYRLSRNGADYGLLQALESGTPTLRMDEAGEIKTSLLGTFAANPAANWLTDEIRPELVIDGTPHPLGVFLPASALEVENETTRAVQIEAFDRCWIVQDNKTESILSLAAGTNYLTAVKQLLTQAGIVLVLETPTGATLPERREDWDIGTSFLTIINDLLAEINYKPLWFNAQGVAMLQPVSVPTAENIEHVLDSSNVRSLLLPEFARETDIYSAPNVFLCICSNPDKSGPMVARAENNNPQNPLSIQRRGRRIMQVTKLNNIASQAELQAYVDRQRNESLYTGEILRVSTALLPGYGVGDVTALRYDQVAAICLERAWEMELKVGGKMAHRLERVVINLG